MAFRNVTIVNGVKIELKDLDPEDRERMRLELNRRAASRVGYVEVQEKENKTA